MPPSSPPTGVCNDFPAKSSLADLTEFEEGTESSLADLTDFEDKTNARRAFRLCIRSHCGTFEAFTLVGLVCETALCPSQNNSGHEFHLSAVW